MVLGGLPAELAAFAKEHPETCSLTETTREGSAVYKVNEARMSILLSEPLIVTTAGRTAGERVKNQIGRQGGVTRKGQGV